MSVYKLAASISGGTENDLASIDIQSDGTLYAVHAAVQCDLDADGEFARAEVSFLSTQTIGSNDSRGSIFGVAKRVSLTTSGVGDGGINAGLSGLRIPVMAGERVHLHANSTAGVTGGAEVYMYVEDRLDPNIRRRR